MSIDRQSLLKDLQRQVKRLEGDLREQVETRGEVHDPPRGEYDRAFTLGRTAATWVSWRDERVTQAAVGWVLGTVFVRFCEDNGLLSEPYLAGPSPERLTLAEESQAAYFKTNRHDTDREWLLASFAAIGATQAGRLLFDPAHNALYQIPVSHDAAKALIAFWRRRGDDGRLGYDFTDPDWDTRFLGDLYQDLSEAARKRYALLQTPEFVEEFILDLTLKPAINEFGHDVVKVIDPTCGSGHFLLGTFHRLLAEWDREAPRRDRQERVRLALDAVYGVDVNPFAVAIARFRLLLAAIRACGFDSVKQTEGYDFPIHVAIGDSLIKHRQLDLLSTTDELADFRYDVEDLDDHPGILEPGRYHVVVGNPPYITVKDKKLNQLYRDLYDACSGKYALSVPFAQRFFELAKRGDDTGQSAGHVGQITANSFMKREFGKKLIEQFFAHKVDLTHVIDTSGAYIPGHGTPTVILAGRRRNTGRTETVRAVLGIRGEPQAPVEPAQGHVWRSIVESIDTPGTDTEWLSVTDLSRSQVGTYPWSLHGGGAAEISELIVDNAASQLADLIQGDAGFAAFSAADDAFYMPPHWHRRFRTPELYRRPLVAGEDIRDWHAMSDTVALAPYDEDGRLAAVPLDVPWTRHLWSVKQHLGTLQDFSGETRFAANLPWWSWYRWVAQRTTASRMIGLAKVATHNRCYLNRGTGVTNQHVPAVVPIGDVSDSDCAGIVGVLNSSTACFWLKQVSHNKGSTVDTRGARQTSLPWEDFYEFTGTKLQEFPLPGSYPMGLARRLDTLAQRLSGVSPAAVCADGVPTKEGLGQAREEWHAVRGQMIALQEELDWQVYHLYGLLDTDHSVEDPPEIKLGERAFEIVFARRVAAGDAQTEWFNRHGSTPVTEIPEHWPEAYRRLVAKRIEIIEDNRSIALIERPECKRRWATDGWDAMRGKALRDWLLDRCEDRDLWYHHLDGTEQPRPLSVDQLADELRRDPDVLAVAELYAPGTDLGKVLTDLVADQHVPFLAALRYKPSGLAKRADWEDVWDLQRAEDAAATEHEKRRIRDGIPVPPKYTSADFAKTGYWRNRGKLDVPKERFISYPHCGRDGDPSLLLGWAGWNYRDQAQALALLTVEREQTDGWDAARLTPLLAGLRETLPWVRQWHDDFDPVLGDSPAAGYAAFHAGTTNRLHLTDDDLTNWRPPTAGRRRRA